MSELPVDVIAEILSRLPVEPLLRFRCISKSWRALIDSPEYIKLHLNRYVNTNTNRNIIFGDYVYSIASDSLADDDVKLDNPLKNEEFKSIEVVGSCDGLICLSYSKKDIHQWCALTRKDELPVLALWNPSTPKHHKLPNQLPDFPLECGSIEYFITKYGFRYDLVSNDYKVVRLIDFVGKCFAFVCSEVVVYSLKSNLWQRIKDFPNSPMTWGKNVVVICGALHSVVDQITVPYRGNLIVVFDLGVEEYQVMPQLDQWAKNDKVFLEVLGGCLYVVCCNYVLEIVLEKTVIKPNFELK